MLRLESYVEEDFRIAGVSYNDPYSGKPRQEIIKKFIKPGVQLRPVLEPQNEYDGNAIALIYEVRRFLKTRKYHLGYVPKMRAKYLVQKIREGVAITATVEKVVGGTRDKPTRGVVVIVRYP